MAIIWRVFLLIWVIACVLGKIEAATLQKREITESNEKNDDETAASYGAFEQEHIAVNDSKVIIDLYTPTQRPHELKPDESLKGETTADKSVTPFVQVVIHQPDAIGFGTTNDAQFSPTTNDVEPVTQAPSTTAHSQLQLIPPASVNASIKQLEKESKQKQGQIIIRYAFLNPIFFHSFRNYREKWFPSIRFIRWKIKFLGTLSFILLSYGHVPVVKDD